MVVKGLFKGCKHLFYMFVSVQKVVLSHGCCADGGACVLGAPQPGCCWTGWSSWAAARCVLTRGGALPAAQLLAFGDRPAGSFRPVAMATCCPRCEVLASFCSKDDALELGSGTLSCLETATPCVAGDGRPVMCACAR